MNGKAVNQSAPYIDPLYLCPDPLNRLLSSWTMCLLVVLCEVPDDSCLNKRALLHLFVSECYQHIAFFGCSRNRGIRQPQGSPQHKISKAPLCFSLSLSRTNLHLLYSPTSSLTAARTTPLSDRQKLHYYLGAKDLIATHNSGLCLCI